MDNLSVDEARLRPHLRDNARSDYRAARRRLLDHQSQILREAVAEAQDSRFVKPRGATAGGDKRKLRGIPVQARGVGSVQPGTQPEQQATRGQDDMPSDVTLFLLHANARRRAA